MSDDAVRVLVPTGMIGAGFTPESVERGIALGADVIAVDGGSTDSGPHYLGTGTPKTAAAAVARDLRILLRAAAGAGIPLIVGSCGTSGVDGGVDWVAAMAAEILAADRLALRVATIYSEQDPDDLVGRTLRPLPPVKVSYPRPVGQGSLRDRDLHAGQHHVPLAGVVVTRPG